MLFVVRKGVWDAWSPALRDAARASAIAAARAAEPLAAEARARDALAANGVAITRLTAAGQAAFRAAVQPVYDALTPKMDAAFTTAVEQAAQLAAPAAVPAAPGTGSVPAAAPQPR